MKLLIVDDEHYIVNHLISIISEHFHEQLEVEHAYTGVSALKIIEESKIDLMLLDIHMPGITGIEVAKRVAKTLPRCKIIFLTAYDNFNYIYQVSNMPNVSYLLKTETDKTILLAVEKNISLILDEQKKLTILDEASKKTFLLNHLLLQQPLNEIFLGSPFELIKGELDFLGADFHFDLLRPFFIMYMQIRQRNRKDTKQNPLTHTVQYLQLVDRLLGSEFFYAMLDLDNCCYLWFFQPQHTEYSESSTLTKLKNMADDFSSLSASTLHRNLMFTLYPKELLFHEICEVSHQLPMQTNPFMISQEGLSSVVIWEENAPPELTLTLNKSKMEKHLQELNFHLYQGNRREYLLALSDIQMQCSSIHSMHHLSVIKIYNTIALMLINYIDLYQLQTALAEKIGVYSLYYLNDFTTWQQAFSYLSQVSSYIFQLGDSKTADKIDSIIAKIKLYVNEHLEENITLAALSGLVNYNETYISRLFRQNTGCKLSDYIHDRRISKAKELLTQTADSMNQIAAMVGFDTAQYFSIVFKKAVGMSPSDFRRAHLS